MCQFWWFCIDKLVCNLSQDVALNIFTTVFEYIKIVGKLILLSHLCPGELADQPVVHIGSHGEDFSCKFWFPTTFQSTSNLFKWTKSDEEGSVCTLIGFIFFSLFCFVLFWVLSVVVQVLHCFKSVNVSQHLLWSWTLVTPFYPLFLFLFVYPTCSFYPFPIAIPVPCGLFLHCHCHHHPALLSSRSRWKWGFV